MKFISQEKTEKNTVRLKFLIAKDVFDAQTDKVFNRKKAKITIQGFRPGKAPRHMIEKIYGKGVFYEEALNDLLPAEYEAALKESGIKAVAAPSIDVEKIDEEGVLVVADVTVKPEVEIEGYAGIEAEKAQPTVSEEEIDAEIARVRERQGRETEVDRPAKEGDTVNIDYEGFCGGVAFDGGKGENYDLKLGSHTFIPGFEEQIAGHAAGEEFDVNVTFPTEYHAEELAGKEAVFKTKIHTVKETQLPELDDEFVKDVSEFDTMTEYRADVQAKLLKGKQDEADKAFESKLLDALLEKLEAEVPEAMIRREAENMLRDYDMNLRGSGLDLNNYLKYTGQTLDQLREQFMPRAEKQVKIRLALEKIAQKESLQVSDEEIEKEISDMASSYQMTAEQVKQYVDPEDLKNDLLVRKAMDFVKEKAIPTAPAASADAEAEAAPAPKKRSSRSKKTETPAE